MSSSEPICADRLYTIAEVMRLEGTSHGEMYRRINRGQYAPVVKDGRSGENSGPGDYRAPRHRAKAAQDTRARRHQQPSWMIKAGRTILGAEDGPLGSDDPGKVVTERSAGTTSLQHPRRKGGQAPRRKGDGRERNLVRILQAAGFAATRIPLSGSAGGRFGGDVTTPLLGRDLTVEVKARRRFAQLYRWLDDADVLVLQGDREQPLVVVRLRLALDVAVAAERGRR
jgi:hypothetical protein